MGNSRLEILQMIQDQEISLEEGRKRLLQLSEPRASATPSSVDYFCTEWVKKVSGGSPAGDPFGGSLLLFEDGEDVHRSLCGMIEPGAGPVILVRPGASYKKADDHAYVIDPSARADYDRLFADLQEQGILPRQILHLWSTGTFSADAASLQAQMERGIYSLFHLTGALMARKAKQKTELLYLYEAAGEEMQPAYAAVSGFARTLRMENPLLICKTVELETMRDALLAAWRELGANEEDVEVKFQGGERYVREIRNLELSEATEPLPLKQRGVYLITGGAGGLGLIFAEHLAKTCRARLVLTGRSPLDAKREAKLRSLEALGADVLYLQGDISQRQDVERIVAAARNAYGRIDGILHAAGILRDAFVMKKTVEEVEQVLAPKVFGALHLDGATKDDALDCFVLFSSMAGAAGNVGQSDYAYANAFLDQFSALRSRMERSGRTLSINWPLWEDGGMQIDEEAKEWMKQQAGVVPLATENGLAAFEYGLKTFVPQLMVVERATKGTESVGEQKRETMPEPSQEQGLNQDKAEAYVKGIFAKAIKLSTDQIDSQEPLETYGIDSTMIMQVNRELEKHFGSLSKTLLFEYQTIHDLTDYFTENHREKLIEQLGGPERPKAEAAAPTAAPAPAPTAPAAAAKAPAAAPVQPRTRSAVPGREGRSRFAAPAPVQTASAQAAPPAKPSKTTVEAPKSSSYDDSDDIAIIGIDGRFPEAEDLEQFWHNLTQGLDCITEIPLDRWDYRKYYDPDKNNTSGKMYSKWGGFVPDVDKFDPLFFSITPKEAETMDPQERLFMECVYHAFEDAGYTRSSLDKSSVGVFVGVMYGHYQLFHTELGGTLISPATSYASIANRVSYFFNFQGPSMALDTMCSSSLTSIHLAMESIKRGESDIAVAGGVNVSIHPNKYQLLSVQRFMASDGKCKSFGVEGDGYVPGEGVGAVILKPLSKALADGDNVYAVIKSASLNHGGKTNGYTVPNPKAQGNVIAESLTKSGINPRTISYIEAHGTGTSLGDPIEITGLSRAFRAYTKDKQFCSIGSVKSNIGHLESAAGVAGVAKILLQMKHKQLVPSLHSEVLNPNINFEDSPFYVQRELTEWKQPVVIENGVEIQYPRRAGISSFGAGGSNAHLVLEEHERQAPQPERAEPRIFVLSARSEERLKAYAEKILAHLNKSAASDQPLRLIDLAFTLQVGREALEERMAAVVETLDDLKQLLTDFIGGKPHVDGLYRGTVRKGKSDTALIEGREGEEFIKVIINDKKLGKLARLWVTGVDMDWNLLYAGEETRRISLPGYPFARERYWIDVVEIVKAGSESGGGIAKLHPLVGRNISTLRQQAYATELMGDEFFLADHVVNGRQVLPGVCYLEMARAAGALAGEAQVLKLKNVVWAAPVTLTDAPVEVTVSLQPSGDKVEYVIASGATVHSQGSLVFEAAQAQSAEYVDLRAVRERCLDSRSGHEYYGMFENFGFRYGTRMQTIRDIAGNRTEMLSRLELPGELQGSGGDYALHPALLDGALQTVGGLMFEAGAQGGETYLPYALGEVEILAPLTDVCYAYVTAQEGGSAAVKKFDIRLTDETGRVLVRITDYSAREMKQPAASKKASDDLAVLELLQKLESGTLSSDEADKLMEEML